MAEFFSDSDTEVIKNPVIADQDLLEIAHKIKNLAPDKREIIDAVIKVDKASKNEQAAASGK